MFRDNFGQSSTSLICPIHYKTKDQLVNVCKDPLCVAMPLLCIKCDAHNGHKDKTASFYQFMSDIDAMLYDESILQQTQAAEQYIKQMKIECLQTIVKVKDSILDRLNKLENKTVTYFDSLVATQKRMANQYGTFPIRQLQMREGQSLESIADEIRQLRTAYSTKEQTKAYYFDRLSKIKANQTEKNRSLINAIFSLKQLVEKQITLIDEHFTQETPPLSKTISSKAILQWNPLLTHTDLTVEGLLLRRSADKKKEYCVCSLGNVQMDSKNHCLYSWSIEIQSLMGYLYIGIVKPQQEFLRNQFVLEKQSLLNKGHYCLCSTGDTFSDSSHNINNDGFPYAAGDTIKMEYDPSNRKLTFSKRGKKLEMTVGGSKGEKYRLVVYLWSVGDKVKLIKS